MTSYHKYPRRGMFTVLVIVLLVVVAALTTTFAKSLVMQSRQAKHRLQHRQATRLARSGLERAIVRLQSDTAYEGETWTPKPLEGGAAEVVIAINANESQKTVRVVSRYPLDSLTPATAEFALSIPDDSKEASDAE